MTQSISSLNHVDAASRVTAVIPGDMHRHRQAPLAEYQADAVEQFDGLPAEPPHAVMAEVAAAFDRLDALRAERVSLKFDVLESGRVHIAVVGEDGEIRREIPAVEAMEIAAGERPVLPPERRPDTDEQFHIDLEA